VEISSGSGIFTDSDFLEVL